MQKILIVSPYFVVPNNHGGKTDILNRVIALKKMNFEIDFLYTEEIEVQSEVAVKELKQYVENIYFVKRTSGVSALVSFKPYQVQTRNKLREIELKKTYDITILEGDYVGEVLENKHIVFGKIILRVHNNESVYFYNLFKSSIKKLSSIYYLSDAIKFSIYSRQLFSRIKNFLFISSVEYQKSNKLTAINAISLSTDFPSDRYQEFAVKNNYNVLFVGSLFMSNNIEAIIWYLENIHEDLLKFNSSYTFNIVGSSKGNDLSELKTIINKYERVNLAIDVKELLPHYQNSTVFINTMFNGAGVKVKSIEAIVNGLPLISTSIGVEGTGLEHLKHVFVANDKTTFLKGITKLLLDSNMQKQLVMAGQNHIQESSHEKLLPDFLKKII